MQDYDIEKMIVSLLEKEDAPLKGSEIASKLNLPARDVSKALKELNKKGVTQSPARCCHFLSDKSGDYSGRCLE